MLSKADLSFIRALGKASERRASGLFVAEGSKLVHDMLGSFACAALVVSQAQWVYLEPRIQELEPQMRPQRVEIVPESFDFGRISSLRTPQPALALLYLPQLGSLEPLHRSSELLLLLDGVQDPGNLGTILRTADWFGVRHVLLAPGSADAFSPKVVQASMGALCRVHTIRLEAGSASFLSAYRGEVYGTFLDGTSLYTLPPSRSETGGRLLVMGNEGQGISPEVEHFVTQRVFIPPYAPEGMGSESLNVAIATAICLSELRRP